MLKNATAKARFFIAQDNWTSLVYFRKQFLDLIHGIYLVAGKHAVLYPKIWGPTCCRRISLTDNNGAHILRGAL